MKTLDAEGKLVNMGPAKEWFTVRFDKNLKYFNRETIGRYAQVYELARQNEFYGLTISSVKWTVLWSDGVPQLVLDVTFINPKKYEPSLNVYVRFSLSEEDIHDGIYLEM